MPLSNTQLNPYIRIPIISSSATNSTVPYYNKNIEPLLKKTENVLISAHGNSLRALCKKIFQISDDMIVKLEIPTGNPLIIEFDKVSISFNIVFMSVFIILFINSSGVLFPILSIIKSKVLFSIIIKLKKNITFITYYTVHFLGATDPPDLHLCNLDLT